MPIIVAISAVICWCWTSYETCWVQMETSQRQRVKNSTSQKSTRRRTVTCRGLGLLIYVCVSWNTGRSSSATALTFTSHSAYLVSSLLVTWTTVHLQQQPDCYLATTSYR